MSRFALLSGVRKSSRPKLRSISHRRSVNQCPGGGVRIARRLAEVALLAVTIAACSAVSSNEPADAVRGAVAATVAHDLHAAASFVCAESRTGADHLPFIIEGITGAVDGLSFEEGFAMITFDATGLSVVEQKRNGDEAFVSLSGILVERIDPVQYESAYRAAVEGRSEPVDQALLDQVLQLINGGRYALAVDQTVRVVRQNSTWRVCEQAPTP